MKIYTLMISEWFGKDSLRPGEPTFFIDSIINGSKKHTIRANYSLWKKRFDKIATGEAELSLRVWLGRPYASKQFEVLRLNSTHGIGLQKIKFHKYENNKGHFLMVEDYWSPDIKEVAENDGLDLADFEDWFKNYDMSQPIAIIHFTRFRYNTGRK